MKEEALKRRKERGRGAGEKDEIKRKKRRRRVCGLMRTDSGFDAGGFGWCRRALLVFFWGGYFF